MGSAAFMVSVEQFGGEKAGGSTLEAMHRLVLLDSIASLPFLGVETSESVKTSPCIELTSEQEHEPHEGVRSHQSEFVVSSTLKGARPPVWNLD